MAPWSKRRRKTGKQAALEPMPALQPHSPPTTKTALRLDLLCLLLSLEVLVGTVRKSTSDENDGVEADSESSALLALGSNGTGKGSLGGRVASLLKVAWLAMCSGCAKQRFDIWLHLLRECPRREPSMVDGAYLALQCADLELLESLPSLVAVANVLESLGRVLAADV